MRGSSMIIILACWYRALSFSSVTLITNETLVQVHAVQWPPVLMRVIYTLHLSALCHSLCSLNTTQRQTLHLVTSLQMVPLCGRTLGRCWLAPPPPPKTTEGELDEYRSLTELPNPVPYQPKSITGEGGGDLLHVAAATLRPSQGGIWALSTSITGIKNTRHTVNWFYGLTVWVRSRRAALNPKKWNLQLHPVLKCGAEDFSFSFLIV